MTQEIKPCPFCRTQGKMGDDRAIRSPDGILHAYRIYCPNKKCPVQPRTRNTTPFNVYNPTEKGIYFTTEALAKSITIELWNTRKG